MDVHGTHFRPGKGGDMSYDLLTLMGLALIDLFWWLRK